MSNRQIKRALSLIIAIGFFIALAWQNSPSPKTESAQPDADLPSMQVASNANAYVIHVVDGDTITVKLDSDPNLEVKVRLLGINTPETVDPRRPVECFGKQASDFAKELLSHQRVRLEADPEADEIDKYGRLLRNVYLPDGTDVNALLVADGYANAYVSFPQNQERKAELRRLESEARQAERGLWNPTVCPTTD
ncbi:MAG: thermonuclease family protein [Patescibacteria group bacterium]